MISFKFLECSGDVKVVLESLFGNAGIALDKFLRKLNWVYMFQNFQGLLPYMTWKGKWLEDIKTDVHELNDVREFPILFGEYIVDFLCGPEEEDDSGTEDNTNTGTTAGISSADSTLIFNNVCDLNLARQGIRLFLMSRFVNRKGKKFLLV